MNNLWTWNYCNFHTDLQNITFKSSEFDFLNRKIILIRNNIFIKHTPILPFFVSNSTDRAAKMQLAEKCVMNRRGYGCEMNWRDYGLIFNACRFMETHELQAFTLTCNPLQSSLCQEVQCIGDM